MEVSAWWLVGWWADRLVAFVVVRTHLPLRAQGSELLHSLDDVLNHPVHFLLGVESSEAEAEAGVGGVVVEADGLEDVAGGEVGGGAGGAGAEGDFLQGDEQGLAFDAGEAEIEVSGQSLGRVAVECRRGQAVHQAAAEL